MRLETPFTPKEVNYNEDKFRILDKHFEKMMMKNEASGAAYCMARDGKKFVQNSIGTMSYEKSDTRPIKPDAIFSIASITKLFTATAIFKLIEDGEFRIDTPVGDILEEFKQGPFKEITIAHLLSHTSGMTPDCGTFENPYYQSPWDYIMEGFKKGDEDWLKNALACGMRTDPNKEWAYNSFGYTILGEVVSRVSGVFAEDFIEKEIIEPCEMTDTCFAHNLKQKGADRIIIMCDEMKDLVSRLHNGIPIENTEIEKMCHKIPDTGGGIYSTTSDLVKFGTMLMNGGYHGERRIIGRLTIDRMTRRYTGSQIKDYCWGAGGVEREYGLGPDLRNNLTSLFTKGAYFHEGSGASCLLVDPHEKMVAVWVVPFMDDNWHGEGLYNASAIMWSGIM